MSTNVTPVVLNVPEVNPELEKIIKDSIDPAMIRAAIIAEAEKQAGAAADTAAQDAATKQAADAAAAKAAVEAAASAGFTRTEVIGGKEFTFEAGSELELERMVNTAFKIAYAVQEDRPTTEVVVDDAAAKAAAEAETAAQAELELKFKRGEISTKEYLDQSGAIKSYLEEQGVPLAELKTAVENQRSSSFEQSWAEATEAFKNSPAGADWPGGDNNRELLGLKLISLNKVEAEDKVAALAEAWQVMKASKLYFPVADNSNTGGDAAAQAAAKAAADKMAADAAIVAAEAQRVSAAATAAAEAAKKTPRTSSSVFGASSGVGGGAGSAERSVAKQVELPKDASPTEILDAWKAAQVAQGKNPNDAFTETFSSRR